MRSVCLLLIGALVMGAPELARAQGAGDDIERPEVTKLTFRGVKHVDLKTLKKSVATDQSHCASLLYSWICPWYKGSAVYVRRYLDETELQKDVLRVKVFYWQRGYRNTEVDTVVTGRKSGKVKIAFRVTEGPPTLIDKITVLRPDSLLTPKQLRRIVLLRAGKELNTLAQDSTLTRFREALWQRGFADAVITSQATVDTATHRGTVDFLVQPGSRTVVGEIHVHGRKEVAERSIRNSLLFHPGDVFHLSDLTRSQRGLYESGLFRRAALYVTTERTGESCAGIGVAPDFDDTTKTTPKPDSVKTVDVCVQEAKLREARASGGFNTVDFFQVEGRFTHYNFLGGARRLDVTATLGNLGARELNGKGIFRDVAVAAGADRSRFFAPTWQASADVRQRWFQSPKNTLGAGVFAHRRSAPGVFIDRGYGATATLTRLLADRAPASANYRFEITTVEAGDVYFCINYGVCDTRTIDALRGRQRLSPLIFSFTPDNSNDPLEPTSGWRGRLDLDHASAFTISDFRYNRAYADASVYRRLGTRGVLATRLRTGIVRALGSTGAAVGAEDLAGASQILHPRKRFYSGGSQSVRGYGENQLGPRVLTIPSSQLRGKNNVRCPLATPIKQCDPNQRLPGESVATDSTPAYDDRYFQPRPLGGDLVIEGSLEVRMPIRGNFYGAAFVDGAWLRGTTLDNTVRSDGAVTPGIGMRYRSPVGPIRVDLGLNPSAADRLPVVTEEETTGGARRLVQLDKQRIYNPTSGGTGITRFLNRLTLHLSIGEAF